MYGLNRGLWRVTVGTTVVLLGTMTLAGRGASLTMRSLSITLQRHFGLALWLVIRGARPGTQPPHT